MKYLIVLFLVITFTSCNYTVPEDEEILTQDGTATHPYIIEEYSNNDVFNLKSGNSYFVLRDLGNNCYIDFETDYDRLDTLDYNSSQISLYNYNINGEFVNITLVTTDYNYRDIIVELKLFNNAFATVTTECYNTDY